MTGTSGFVEERNPMALALALALALARELFVFVSVLDANPFKSFI